MGDRAAAIQFFNKGVSLTQDTTYPAHLTHAYQAFVASCFTDPTFPNPFYYAGNANTDLKYPAAAVACYRRAIENGLTGTDKAKALCNLGWQLQDMGRWDEALSHLHEATRCDPQLSHAHLTLSVLYRDLCDSEKSVFHARECFRLDPKDCHNETALAFALLFDRQFAEGFKHFERRFEWRLHHFANYAYPRWEGEPDQTVFLVADQGLGDTLSFARFVPLAAKRARYLHVVVQAELMDAFSYAFVGLQNINLVPLQTPMLHADRWTTFVSLPFALGLTDDEIRNTPQIKMPVLGVPKTWKVPDRKLHVGIAWAGSPLNDIDRHRNIPIEHFLELYRVPGIQLYSLQVDDNRKQLGERGGGPLIRDLSGYIRTVTNTVSLLQDLDLVVTVESALGHICAAVDKPCIIPYSRAGKDYRIGLDGTDPIWTPKHQIFQQGPDRRWEPVFDRIVEHLRGV